MDLQKIIRNTENHFKAINKIQVSVQYRGSYICSFPCHIPYTWNPRQAHLNSKINQNTNLDTCMHY